MTNNSANQDYTNNSDGFTLGGGTTERKLTVTGGNVTVTGSGSNVYTMPAATDTLVGRASTDTLTNKNLTSATNTFPTLNQSTTGSAATLTTARTIQINLASTTAASFNGSANITPGVTGTLSVGNGGTGVTSSTGSGSTVLSVSPTFTGTPAAPTATSSTSTTQIATTAMVQAAITAALATNNLAIFPVGAILGNASTLSANPSTYIPGLSGTTWIAHAPGRVMVGAGTSDQAFTAGATGGESNHLLTTAEMPSHNHTDLVVHGTSGSFGLLDSDTASSSGSSNPATGFTGGGGTHNNLPPYVVVYMWQRVS